MLQGCDTRQVTGAEWAPATARRPGGSWSQEMKRKRALCRRATRLAGARAASILPTARGKSPVLREDAINSVIFSVFCLFPWNGLMDVNNYQTIKASKCATFYRSKSSNK